MVLRTREETQLPGGLNELRLVREVDGDLLLAWVGPRPADGEREIAMRVPRQLTVDIDAEPDKWASLRESVGEGDVIDFQRDLLVA